MRSGVSLNAQAAIEAAYAVGRDISRQEYQALKLEAMTVGIDADISSCLSINADALRAIDDEEVVMELTNGLSPIVFTPVESSKSDFSYMVLPVRIKN